MEKRLVPKVQTFGGSVSEGGQWSSSFYQVPDSGSLLLQRGYLMVAADLSLLDGGEVSPAGDTMAATLGQTLLNALAEEYYSHLEGAPLSALEAAALTAKERLQTLSPKAQLNLVAAVLWGRVLYVVSLGETSAFLLRQGEAKAVISPAGAGPATASGMVAADDVIILGSSAVTKELQSKLNGDWARLPEKILSPAEPGPLFAALMLRLDQEEPAEGEKLTLLPVEGGIRPRRSLARKIVAGVTLAGIVGVLVGAFFWKWPILRKNPLVTSPPLQSEKAENTENVVSGKKVAATLVVDLAKTAANGQPVYLTGEGDELLVVDSNRKQVLKVPFLTEKITPTAFLPQTVSDLKRLFVGEERFYLFSGQGIYRVPADGSAVTKLALQPELDLAKVVAATSFLNNLYFLVPEGIYKYVPVVGGFGGGENWLKEEAPASVLTGAVDLAVDGDLWVVTKEGGISKFSAGRKQEFVLKDPGLVLKEVVAMFTSESLPNLYLADRGAGAVVTVGKDGKTWQRYLSDGWKDLRSLWVPADGKTVYVLSGSQVWSFAVE
ncbi:MAG: hypothetical protein Q8N84_04475 [bacterium]|nr:hypothetical protein [bacterium]